MVTEYPVQIKLHLLPIGTPWVCIKVAGQEHRLKLTAPEIFNFEFVGRGLQSISVQHYNKSAADKDTAVIIQQLEFFGIHDPKFIWQGQYRPEYPEPWASEQKAAGVRLDTVLTNTTHLGWNGIWQLDFDVPVFTWIHRVQNLGWIYD